LKQCGTREDVEGSGGAGGGQEQQQSASISTRTSTGNGADGKNDLLHPATTSSQSTKKMEVKEKKCASAESRDNSGGGELAFSQTRLVIVLFRLSFVVFFCFVLQSFVFCLSLCLCLCLFVFLGL
jgi:hypothetical protein